MQALTLPLIATLLAASAWAVRADLLTHRIPNRLVGSLLCTGLALQFAFGGWSGLGQAALGAVTGLGVLLPFHLMRAMGAGDVKLLAAFGSLLGPQWTLIAGIYTLIGGGVLAIGYVISGALRAALAPVALAPVSKSWTLRFYHVRERVQELRRERFPYALAIAVGAVASIVQRGDLQAVIVYLSGARA